MPEVGTVPEVGNVDALLAAARLALDARDFPRAFGRLELARTAAMDQANLKDLRSVQALAQKASSGVGASDRRATRMSRELLSALKQNIDFHARAVTPQGGSTTSTSPSLSTSPQPIGRTSPSPGGRSWGKVLGIFGGGVGALLVAIVIVVVAGGSNPKPASAPAPVETRRDLARGWIVRHGGDGFRVRAVIANVILEVGAFKRSPTQVNLDRLATVAQQAHDDLDAIRANFATATDGGALGNAELDMFSGANDLKNAMGALVAEAGAPNAATVAHFNTSYAHAVKEWNGGARTIWHIAHRTSPPFV
jgi:hypothetical protein